MILKADMRMGRLSQEIYYDLIEKIDKGIYTTGTKLPTELELCENYHVSRATIRRAVAKLIEEKRVEIKRGDGTYVLPANLVNQNNRLATKTISIMPHHVVDMMAEVQNYALKQGYMPCLFLQQENGWDIDAERLFLEKVKQEKHAGLLAFLIPGKTSNRDLVSDIAVSGTTVIHIGVNSEDPPMENYILLDYYKAGQMAAIELMISGYKKLIFGTPIDAPAYKLMEKGFTDTLEEHNRIEDYIHYDIPLNIEYYPNASQSVIDFMNSIKETMGLFLANNCVSNAIYNLKDQFDKKIPSELGFISMQERTDLVLPRIDSIEYDQISLLKYAIDCIIEQKEIKMLVKPKLIKRGSLL